MNKISNILTRISSYTRDIFRSKIDQIPIRYFTTRNNVGDAINPYLISKITGKKAFEVKSNAVTHILGIGSIMHQARSKSIVWGSGIMHPNTIINKKFSRTMEILAVRGLNTKELLIAKGLNLENIPLGDPALLMPFFYTPNATKRFMIGIVPHYVDQDTPAIEKLTMLPGVTVIDVSSPPEEFVDKLCECEIVVSSSLHGLILSDAYQIPNIWVILSNDISGGDYKFLDYYTTTDNKSPSPVTLLEINDIYETYNDLTSKAKINNYIFDKDKLLQSFPVRFL